MVMPRERAVFLSDERIETLKRRVASKNAPTWQAFLLLQEQAQVALGRTPHAPQIWYVPGYYRDGPGHISAKAGLQDDANAAYTLALYYRIAGGDAYAAAAARLINAWATQVKTMRTQDDSTLSFSYHFPALILAAGLIEGFAAWPSTEQAAFKSFVREKAVPMHTMARANNWGNWGLVLVLAAASYAGDEALFARGLERWKEFIESQIAADGHLPHEVGRNNGVGERGIWYSHFTLMPQTIAAEIARVNGVDLFDYHSRSGRSLRLAFERLAPWSHRPDTFPYFKGGPEESLRGVDYVSYYEILNARWPNSDAAAMLHTLRPLSASHSTPHLTFSHGDLLQDNGE